jgi:phosphatidylinositol alpha-1,6-mannosyltransferase
VSWELGDLGRPAVGAITLHEGGGGIAAVSRLVSDVLAQGRAGHCRTWSLIDQPHQGSFETGTRERVAFGARVAAGELLARCDWIFFTHLSLATVQPFVPPFVRRPYAVFLHDVEAWEPQSPSRTRVLRQAFLRVANSSYTARRVTEANPGIGPVVACPLALPSEWTSLAPAAVPPGLALGPHAVLIVGRMVASERYKGHDQLIDAWPQIVAAVPDASLVCAGEGDDVPRLRAKAIALGVGASVCFTGFVSDDDRRALYQHAALFAMPSRREGFGLVYLEAMASRLPCVGSVHDAAPEVIVDGETGLLVDQGDIGGMARQIADLLTDPDRRERMGQAGHRRFASAFTYDAFARRLSATVRDARAQRSEVPVLRTHRLDS